MRKKHDNPNLGILEAIEKTGGQVELASLLGVRQPMVHHYLYIRCPAEKAVEIENKTGVAREKIRPDIFKRIN